MTCITSLASSGAPGDHLARGEPLPLTAPKATRRFGARRAPGEPRASGRPPPRPVPVRAVVRPLGAQAGGQRQRGARLGVAAHELQRAAEAEERVVVRRRAVDDRLELAGGLAVATRAEQRAAEGLADRGLVGL